MHSHQRPVVVNGVQLDDQRFVDVGAELGRDPGLLKVPSILAASTDTQAGHADLLASFRASWIRHLLLGLFAHSDHVAGLTRYDGMF